MLPLLINKNNDISNINEINKAQIELIKEQIQNKNLIIPKNIDIFSDSKILSTIKNQLKINNSNLTKNDLLKIKENIQHLKPGKKTYVVLKIKLKNVFDTVNINVTKEKDIKLWTKNSAIVTSSNILDGHYSSFFSRLFR